MQKKFNANNVVTNACIKFHRFSANKARIRPGFVVLLKQLYTAHSIDVVAALRGTQRHTSIDPANISILHNLRNSTLSYVYNALD